MNCILEYNYDECSNLNQDTITNVIDILIVVNIILNSEINDDFACSRELAFLNTKVHCHSLIKSYGLSIRCIQD